MNGNRVGHDPAPARGTYNGTLSADGRTASGTATWYPPSQRWTAVIEGGSTVNQPSTQAGQLGRVLRVTEGVGGPGVRVEAARQYERVRRLLCQWCACLGRHCDLER